MIIFVCFIKLQMLHHTWNPLSVVDVVICTSHSTHNRESLTLQDDAVVARMPFSNSNSVGA